MDPAYYERRKQKFLDKNFKKSNSELKKMHEDTIGQSDTELWKTERKKRLKVSKFGNIYKLRPSTSCVNSVYGILYSSVQINATKHGIEMKEVGKKLLAEKHEIVAKDSGLVADSKH